MQTHFPTNLSSAASSKGRSHDLGRGKPSAAAKSSEVASRILRGRRENVINYQLPKDSVVIIDGKVVRPDQSKLPSANNERRVGESSDGGQTFPPGESRTTPRTSVSTVPEPVELEGPAPRPASGRACRLSSSHSQKRPHQSVVLPAQEPSHKVWPSTRETTRSRQPLQPLLSAMVPSFRNRTSLNPEGLTFLLPAYDSQTPSHKKKRVKFARLADLCVPLASSSSGTTSAGRTSTSDVISCIAIRQSFWPLKKSRGGDGPVGEEVLAPNTDPIEEWLSSEEASLPVVDEIVDEFTPSPSPGSPSDSVESIDSSESDE